MSGPDFGAFDSCVFARQLFDGLASRVRHEQLISIAEGRIAFIGDCLEHEAKKQGAIICDVVTPGLIDLQINGANNSQFNFTPTVDTLRQMVQGAQKGGAAHIMPTFITAPDQSFTDAIRAASEAIEVGVPGILGVHLEGPFLSPDRPGIHDASSIRVMTDDDLDILCAPFPGKLLLTVAPETLPTGFLPRLVEAGVIVFAGHSDADANIMVQAEDQGLRGVTHLFNAMSQMQVRDPGVVGATLASNSLYAGIIPDGIHVARENLKIAARCIPERLCLVTDAMLTLAGTQKAFALGGHEITLKNGHLTNADGRLAGAHIAMDECLVRMYELTDLAFSDVVKMATANPASALGLCDNLGTVDVGKRASLTIFDNEWHALSVCIDGVWQT